MSALPTVRGRVWSQAGHPTKPRGGIVSAADHPIRGALTLTAGASLLVLAPIGVGLLVATNAGTIAGAVLGWGLVWRLARPPRARGWEVAS